MSNSSNGSGTYGGSESPAEHLNMRQYRDVNEEQPIMRSVAISSGLMKPGIPFRKNGPDFGKPPPPLGISRTKPGVNMPGLNMLRPLHGSAQGSSEQDVFGVKHEWSGLVSSSIWNVNGEALELIPLDFPLERTHREIHEDACVVAGRISAMLCSLSIETEFDSEKAKAKCTTGDFVCFRIRLYAGGPGGQPVVVELQRRSGSPSSFMRSCRAILAAAEGVGDKLPRHHSMKSPLTMKPICNMQCLKAVYAADPPEQSLSALDAAVDMIRSMRRDTYLLGLENICCLTDPLKSEPSASLFVSKSIILGDDKHDIREDIRVLTERDVYSSEFEDDERPSNHADHLRHLALTVFSNALGLCSKDGSLKAAVESQKWFEDYLIPSLVDELKRSSTSANNAYLAANCLLSLAFSSRNACQLVVCNGGVTALKAAQEFGLMRHELLASEASQCLKIIGVENP